MCSGPRLETSKPSTRTGSRLHAERLLQLGERLDALLAPALAAQAVLGEGQPRVALGELAQAPLVAALGDANLDGAAALHRERLGQQRRALAQGLTDDDQPRHHRGGRVVLGDELLGHLGLVALARVREVEAVALGEDPVAHLEDLRVGVGALDGDPDQIGALGRLRGDAAALHQRPDRLQAVAVDRRPLELLRAGRLGHLALEVALDVAVAAARESRRSPRCCAGTPRGRCSRRRGPGSA